jgi:DNA-binding LacI/PurR family transcriptional regulator
MTPTPPRSKTLLDVARAVGVSRATVSNAFTHPQRVRDELRDRILEAARELGYSGPNPVGRMLRTGRMGAIAFMVNDELPYAVTDPYASGVLRGVAEACETAGVNLLLMSASDPVKVAQRLPLAPVDAILLQCVEDGSPVVALALARGVPVVSFEPTVPGATGWVVSDNLGGSRAAAGHLMGLGHRRFGIISLELANDAREGPVDAARLGRANFVTTRERFEGYRQVLFDEGGLDWGDVVVEERVNTRARGRDGVAALLARKPDITALLCMSDELALGAMAELKARGIDVPGQISIVGFDDNPFAGVAIPPLTTIRQPLEERGRLAAEIALGLRIAPEPIVLPQELIVRGTTAPPPSA